MKKPLLRLFCLLSLPLLASCNNGGAGPITDPKAFLDKMDGPKVTGIEDGLLNMAKDRENVGSYKEAAGIYKQLADKYPEKSIYKVQLGDMLRRAGDVDSAAGMYELVLQKEPDNGPAQEGKALALMQKGAFDQAEPLLLSLKASGKGSWRTFNALGILAAGRQQSDQAAENFAAALKLNPDNPSVLNNIGLSQAINRQFDASFTSFAQAGALATGKPELKKQIDLNSALAYAASGKLDKAEEISKRYYSEAAQANNMAIYAHLANDDQLAKTYLNMALTESKSFYQRAWSNLESLGGSRTSSPPNAKQMTMPVAPSSEAKPVMLEAAPKAKMEKTTTVSKDTVKILTPPPTAAITAPAAVEEKKQMTVTTTTTTTTPAAVVAAPAPVQELAAPPATALTPPPAPAAAAPAAPAPVMPAAEAVPATAPASRVQVVTPKKKDAENGFDAIGNWVGGLLD